MRSTTGLEVRLQGRPASLRTGAEPPLANTRPAWVVDLLVALLLFGLMREWLAPILRLSNVLTLREQVPFFAAIGAVLLLDGLRVPRVVGWPLKLATCVYALQSAIALSGFGGTQEGTLFTAYARETTSDLLAVLAGEPDGIGAYNRTLFFLIGWMLLAGVVYSLLLHTRRGYWFTGTTFLFLLALQLGAGFELGAAAMRTFALGLGLEALLRYSSFADRVVVYRRAGAMAVWGGLAALLLAAGLLAGGLAARLSSGKTMVAVDWDKLGNRIESWVGGGDRSLPADGMVTPSGPERTGYGNDDTRLGAPLQPDDQVAFIAYTPQLTYWRGESKDTYDGYGWRQTGERQDLPADLSLSDLAGNASETIEQQLVFPAGAPVSLVAGGKVVAVEEVLTDARKPASGDVVWVDAGTGKLTARLGGDRVRSLRLRVAPPPERASLQEQPAGAGSADPAGLERDLQLPATLPGRVRSLALTLTAGRSGTLAKADAVERYLNVDGGFRYSLSEPRPPSAGQDLVDQFLFVQKVGYCDHFSTAMVVLLRAAGVPARWVKGYAPGSIDVAASRLASAESGQPYVVTVRNRDAHSWVEVYVSGEGWVTYDPTPGYSAGGVSSASASVAPVGAQASAAAAPGEGLRGRPGAQRPSAAAGARGLLQGATIPNVRGLVKGAYGLMTSELAYSVGTWPQWTAFTARLRLLSWRQESGLLAALGVVIGVWMALAWHIRRAGPPLWLVLRGHHRSRRRPQYAVRVLDRLWSRAFRLYGPLAAPLTYREYVASLPSAATPEVRSALAELAHLTELQRYDTASVYWIPKQQLRSIWQRLRA